MDHTVLGGGIKAEEHLIGIISDTHGLIRPEAMDALKGSEHILHAGDIGDAKSGPRVLYALRTLAPVTAVRGNNDKGPWAEWLPKTATLEVSGIKVYLLHRIADLKLDLKAEGYKAVVMGHSHRGSIKDKVGIFYINPGSAGPRRFGRPATLAFIKIADGNLKAELMELKV